jgi:hypothetical protein
MVPSEYVIIAGVAAVLGFLWTLHRDMRSLSDRVSRLEGLLEGLRDAVAGRTVN